MIHNDVPDPFISQANEYLVFGFDGDHYGRNYLNRFKVPGSRFQVQGSRFQVPSFRFKVPGFRFKVNGIYTAS